MGTIETGTQRVVRRGRAPRSPRRVPAAIAAFALVILGLWVIADSRKIGLLAVGLVITGALTFLALARYEMFVLALLAARASLDVFKVGDRTSMAVDPAALFAVLLIVAGLWWLSLDRDAWRSSASPVRGPLIALVACGAFNLVAARQPVVSAVELLRLVAVLVMVMSLERLVTTPAYLRLLMGTLLVSCAVPVATGLFQIATGTGEVSLGGFARLTGTFLHPNPFAFYLALFVVMGVAVVPHVEGRARILTLVALAGCGVCLVFTYTRTAWIGLVVGLVVVAMFQSRKLLVALCVGAVLVGVLVPSVSARFSDLGSSTDRSGAAANSLAWRTSYWKETLDLVDNPGMGIGLKMVSTTVEEQKAPHNDFVRVFVELGALGLLAYCWMLVGIARIALKGLRSTTDGLARGVAVGFAGCAATFLVISTVSNLVSQVVVVWYFFAFAMAAHGVSKLGRVRLRAI